MAVDEEDAFDEKERLVQSLLNERQTAPWWRTPPQEPVTDTPGQQAARRRALLREAWGEETDTTLRVVNDR
jgi:hypothetical protein